MSITKKASPESIARKIKRRTRRKFSAEVEDPKTSLDGLKELP